MREAGKVDSETNGSLSLSQTSGELHLVHLRLLTLGDSIGLVLPLLLLSNRNLLVLAALLTVVSQMGLTSSLSVKMIKTYLYCVLVELTPGSWLTHWPWTVEV